MAVKATQSAAFQPTQLQARSMSIDIATGFATYYYELTQTFPDSEGIKNKSITEKGHVLVHLNDLTAISNALTGGNPQPLNDFLSQFNLTQDEQPTGIEGTGV